MSRRILLRFSVAPGVPLVHVPLSGLPGTLVGMTRASGSLVEMSCKIKVLPPA